jgi:hypothetical protein
MGRDSIWLIAMIQEEIYKGNLLLYGVFNIEVVYQRYVLQLLFLLQKP